MSVEIEINDKYAITTDAYQWMVCTKEKGVDKKTGEPIERWRSRTYHPSLESALKSLSNKLLRESDAKSWRELNGCARDVVALLGAKFPNISISVKECKTTLEVNQ